MKTTTYVAHITVDTPDDVDPARYMPAVERALRTADIVNPPGVTGIQLDCAEFEVTTVLRECLRARRRGDDAGPDAERGAVAS